MKQLQGSKGDKNWNGKWLEDDRPDKKQLKHKENQLETVTLAERKTYMETDLC